MAVTANMVKDLREKTGAGMMDCKKALAETNGDFEKAVDYLRAKGLAAAQKKQSRIAAEGAVFITSKNDKAVLFEINCETDFVAKGDDFQKLGANTGAHILSKNGSFNPESDEKVKSDITELTLKIGEKISFRRFTEFKLQGAGLIGTYVHGSKIGVMVEFASESNVESNPVMQELAKDIAMHVAASSPKFLVGSEMDENFKQREAEIYATQLREQGKPENMIANIIKGKLSKLASEVCLMEQKFVKNPDISIQQYVNDMSKQIGQKITIKRFAQMNLGEGIEKKEDNFAEEVAKMTGR